MAIVTSISIVWNNKNSRESVLRCLLQNMHLKYMAIRCTNSPLLSCFHGIDLYIQKFSKVCDLGLNQLIYITTCIIKFSLKFYEKEGGCYVEKYESITTQSLRRHYPYQVMVGSVLSWRILRAPLCQSVCVGCKIRYFYQTKQINRNFFDKNTSFCLLTI